MTRIQFNGRRSALTTVVLGAFAFFWFHGPLQWGEAPLSHTQAENEFFAPKLVAEVSQGPQDFGLLAGEMPKGEGYGLIGEGSAPSFSHGLLADASPMAAGELADQLKERLTALLPEGQSAQVVQQEGVLLAEVKEGGQLRQLYLESPEAMDVQGYAGPIRMGIFLGLDGQVQRVVHLSSQETQSYLEKIARQGYYAQYERVSLWKGAQEIDATSGATITTKAMGDIVTRTVEEQSGAMAHYTDRHPEDFSVSALLSDWWMLHLGLLLLIGLLNHLPFLPKTKKMRLGLSALCLAYLGLGLNSSFTYTAILQPFLGTQLSMFMGGYVLLVLLGAIWGKNTYCKYVCPFGAAQMIALHFSPFGNKKLPLSNRTVERLRYALTLGLVGAFVAGYRQAGSYELFPDLFGLDMASGWFFLALLFVLVSMRFPMLWCRAACPTGCVLDSISKQVKKKKVSV